MEVSLTNKTRATCFLSAATGSITTAKVLLIDLCSVLEVATLVEIIRPGVLSRTVVSPPEVARVLLGCLMSLTAAAPIHVRTIPPVTTALTTVATVPTATANTRLTVKARELTVTAAVVKVRLGCFISVLRETPPEPFPSGTMVRKSVKSVNCELAVAPAGTR